MPIPLWGSFNSGFHMRAGLWLAICATQNFHVEQHISCREPGFGIEQLYLNFALRAALYGRRGGRGDSGKCAGPNIFDYKAMLLLHAMLALHDLARPG